jgi:hypothetical protein
MLSFKKGKHDAIHTMIHYQFMLEDCDCFRDGKFYRSRNSQLKTENNNPGHIVS